MKVIDQQTGNPIVSDVTYALTPIKRLVGLIGRKSLPPGYGLYFPRCSSIHTCFMRFKIDIIYINKNNEVVKTVSEMKPWRFSACCGAFGVIEVFSGHIKKNNITEGMVLQFVEGGGE